MDNVIRNSSEILAYLCGMLFCIGMGALMVGQMMSANIGLMEMLSLSLLMAADGLLLWVSLRGLMIVLTERRPI